MRISDWSSDVCSSDLLGRLKPETSTAKTVSVILTPDLSGALWGGLKTRLAVVYFDIKVKEEITLLGAGNILTGCSDSDNFADEAFCGLFARTEGRPEPQHVANVTDQERKKVGLGKSVHVRRTLRGP